MKPYSVQTHCCISISRNVMIFSVSHNFNKILVGGSCKLQQNAHDSSTQEKTTMIANQIIPRRGMYRIPHIKLCLVMKMNVT